MLIPARVHLISVALLCASHVLAQTTASPNPEATAQNSVSATTPCPTDSQDGPEVAPGIRLGNYGAAWMLDAEQGPKLLRSHHSLGYSNRHVGENIMRSFMAPAVRQVTSMDIQGAVA